MYYIKIMEEEILKASKYYPVVMVCGQPQVDKSTMLKHIKEENRRYVTLDDPKLFIETYGYPIVIDEFQRALLNLLEIKRILDKNEIDLLLFAKVLK